jgi:hydrogenase/urease accessory protein HupE
MNFSLGNPGACGNRAMVARRRVVAVFAAALLTWCPSLARAHDPGLSSLELRIAHDRIVAILSLAAADVHARLGDRGAEVAALALDAIELRVDGVRLRGVVESSDIDAATGSRVVLRFDRSVGSRLTVRSALPGRLALGHRELLVVRGPDGRALCERMLDARESEADLELGAKLGRSGLASQFAGLGVRHILGGYDHLLFLAALLLGVERLSHVVKTVTAFTVAHSVTLALAVLGFVHVPGAVVEPLIAASIVFVGIENLVRGQMGPRWKLTFAFGLVHGFGFAGALQDLGIAGCSLETARALGLFNLGVETGQLAVAMLLWPAARRLNAGPVLNVRLAPACSMVVVVMGMYWLVERTFA